jgi:glycosyltransferase involved in cell wall biosynthesis
MLLWYKENPEYLKQSVESMASQTIPPSEFVFVQDHDVSSEIQYIIKKYTDGIPVKCVDAYDLFGSGLGSIRARGVENCSFELIACMDSDDIAFPDRCEKQLQIFDKNPDMAIVGGVIAEFSVIPEEIISYRKVPEKHKDIMKFAKLRSPFNHPSVMFQKSAVIDVGNYRSLGGCEDYDLWFRLLKNGYKGYNISVPILYYRTGDQFVRRRANKLHYQNYIDLKKELRKENFINSFEYLLSISIQFFFYHSPVFVQNIIYTLIRRIRISF